MASGAVDFGPPPGAGQPAQAGPQDLVGGDSQQSQTTDAESQNQGFAKLIRSIHTDLENLARQYPEMQEYASKAKKSLTEGMVKRMQSQQQPGESAQTPKVPG